MRTPTPVEAQLFFQHIYDPVKAHEYYIKNRDLKGRKKAKLDPLTGRDKAKAQPGKIDLKSLPMVQKGASVGDAAEFVNSLKGMGDKELSVEEARFRDAADKQTTPAIKANLLNRAETIAVLRTSTGKDPRTGKTRDQIHKDARAKQRAELSQQIRTLEGKLSRLSAMIVKKQHEQDAAERKSMGKKERAAKEKTKPKTAADKAEAARESKKYRDKHQQELNTKAKSSSSSKSSAGSSTKSQSKTTSLATEISRLDALATKVAGKIAVAKDKLAAL